MEGITATPARLRRVVSTSPLAMPSPKVISAPLELPDDVPMLLEVVVQVNETPTMDVDCVGRDRVHVAKLNMLCTVETMQDAAILADHAGSEFVMITTIVSIVALGHESLPTQCKVVLAPEAYFQCDRAASLSQTIHPVNLTMWPSPEQVLVVDVETSMPDGNLTGAEVEAQMLWHREEIRSLLTLMEQQDPWGEGSSDDTPPSPQSGSWWIPLDDGSSAHAARARGHVIPRAVLVVVERSFAESPTETEGLMVRVRIIEPRLCNLDESLTSALRDVLSEQPTFLQPPTSPAVDASVDGLARLSLTSTP